MPAAVDPRILVAYSMDEGGSLDVRKSLGSAAYHLTPATDTGSEGVPAVTDGLDGRAADLRSTISGLTTSARRLIGSAARFDAGLWYVPLPQTTGQSGFAYGGRFRYRGGAVRAMSILEVYTADYSTAGWFGLLTSAPDGSGNCRPHVVMPDHTIEYAAAGSWTDTDGLTTDYTGGYCFTNASAWWRFAVRYYNVINDYYGIQLVLYNEASGKRYRLTRGFLNTAFANPDVQTKLVVGSALTASRDSIQGEVDSIWILDGDLSEEQAVDLARGGLKIPREADATYRGLPRVIIEARYHDEQGEERSTGPVFVDDTLLARIGARAGASAFSVRVRSYAPGRPMSCKWFSALYAQKAGSRRGVR